MSLRNSERILCSALLSALLWFAQSRQLVPESRILLRALPNLRIVSTMAGRASHLSIAVLIVAFLALASANRPSTLKFFLQQRFGVNELQMVPAARPAVNGTIAGFGTEVVYEYPITKTANASSELLGFWRGTGVTVNNSVASTTFFVTSVIFWDNDDLQGTISQQGEAIFSLPSWEYTIVGGTGDFRFAFGYSTGKSISFSVLPDNTTLFVTEYTLNLFYHR